MFKHGSPLRLVLLHSYLSPFKVQSDFARQYAQEVACLASLGFISTLEGPQQYGRKWRVTGIGLDKLRNLGLICD